MSVIRGLLGRVAASAGAPWLLALVLIGSCALASHAAAQPTVRTVANTESVRRLADLPYGESAKQRIDV